MKRPPDGEMLAAQVEMYFFLGWLFGWLVEAWLLGLPDNPSQSVRESVHGVFIFICGGLTEDQGSLSFFVGWFLVQSCCSLGVVCIVQYSGIVCVPLYAKEARERGEAVIYLETTPPT